MDKTPIYIKMLEGATKEIQSSWKPKNGDAVWHPNEGTEHMGDWEFPETFAIVILSKDEDENWWRNMLWLPRQDQLQEIYLDFLKKQLDSDEVIYMPGFVVYIISELKMLALAWNRDYIPLESFEQLLLLLIMIQVFNKRWDDDKEKWIKCRENWWYVSKEFLKEVEEKIDREEKENAKSN